MTHGNPPVPAPESNVFDLRSGRHINPDSKPLGVRPKWAEPPKAPFVYFIKQCRAAGLIKIGWAKEPRKRLIDLQIGAGCPLMLLAVESGGRAREAELHARFAIYRMHGEWFHAARELKAYIKTLGKAPR